MNRPLLNELTVFTVGHSNHPIERFRAILKQTGIEMLADIRRFPGSRKHPHFHGDALASALIQHGIAYHWIEALGGRRPKVRNEAQSQNSGLRNQSFRNYADYMATPQFRAGLEELMTLAQERRTAMMCAEGLFWQCHRRLVSDYLVAAGADVQHIFPNGTTKPHVMTSGVRVAEGGVTYPAAKSLFDDRPHEE